MNKLLSKLQIEQYENDGYVVPDFKMPEDTIKKIDGTEANLSVNWDKQ